nr:DUF1236 domain-containing protein [Lutibaculum baratangense]
MSLAATVAYIGMSSVSFAQTSATATTDLNVRAGPGPEHAVVTVIPGSEQATLNGCLEGSKWCQVDYGGTTGWAYSDYLAIQGGEQRVVVTERQSEVPVVTYEGGGGGAAAGAVSGAVTGALIGGPVGAAIGGAAGASMGAAIDPPTEVRTYVTENRVEPVYLEGEVVVGAGLPDTVELRTVPDYDYDYVYVNGQPVLVDPGTREIVYVVR